MRGLIIYGRPGAGVGVGGGGGGGDYSTEAITSNKRKQRILSETGPTSLGRGLSPVRGGNRSVLRFWEVCRPLERESPQFSL